MTSYVNFISLRENVHLMSALISAFTHISPAWNAKLAKIFIPQSLKPRARKIHGFKAVNHRHYVNYRLCRQSRYRRAANVMYGGEIAAKHTGKLFRFAFKLSRPAGVIFRYDNVLRHMRSSLC